MKSGVRAARSVDGTLGRRRFFRRPEMLASAAYPASIDRRQTLSVL